MWIHIGSINGTPVWSGSRNEKASFEQMFKQWFNTQEEMASQGFTPQPCWVCQAIPFGTTWEAITWVEIECEGVQEWE